MTVDQLDTFETPDAVDVLVAEYLDALDHGQAPSPADWLDRHPEHAAELARFLDDLQRLLVGEAIGRAAEIEVVRRDRVLKLSLTPRDAEPTRR